MKYQTNPIVEAKQFNGMDDYLDISKWINDSDSTLSADEVVEFRNPIMIINTENGTMVANQGDYIVKGKNGFFYPVTEDIFLKTYEPVE